MKRSSFMAVVAAALSLLVLACLGAELVSPHTPFDVQSLSIMDSNLPPAFIEGGETSFVLGTDNQGRDILSAIFYGGRLSLMVGIGSVLLSLALGVLGGAAAGYFRGLTDAIVMRIADVQSSFPPILVALLLSGVSRLFLSPSQQVAAATPLLIVSIGLSGWVQCARVARASTLVEAQKDYVMASKALGLPHRLIIWRHILPNILNPIIVIALIQLSTSILIEASLSFLGLGTSASTPSLGGLIQIGSAYLLSGAWWISLFPGLALIALIFGVNVLADWWHDRTNPRLQ